MDKVISSKIVLYSIFSIVLFVATTFFYVVIGDQSDLWWAIDKINDRIFAINLLFIASFTFLDLTLRVFARLNMGYLLMYLIYELLYIYNQSNPTSFKITTYHFAALSISYLFLGAVALIILSIYVSKRSRN